MDLYGVASLILCSGEDAQAQQLEPCPAIHGALDELEAMDLSFYRPIAPWVFQGSEEGCFITA